MSHLAALGFMVNWEKSVLIPNQNVTFSLCLDSAAFRARLSAERVEAFQACLALFPQRDGAKVQVVSQAAGFDGVGSQMQLLHINCLELQAVSLSLKHFLSLLRGQHVLVKTDNTPCSPLNPAPLHRDLLKCFILLRKALWA